MVLISLSGFNPGSRRARGQVLYSIPDDQPACIVSRCGKTQDDWALAEPQVVHQATEAIRDFVIAPIVGEGHFALLVDLASGPAWTHAKDSSHYEKPLQSLGWEGQGSVRHIRPLLRARNYWLVSLIHQVPENTACLRWGTIDWAEASPTLRLLTDMEELQQALCIVGLI